MDLYLVKGGPCIPECLPIRAEGGNKNRQAHLSYPKRVEGTFARGHFVLGNLLNPAQIEHQYLALKNTAIAVDDFMPLILVPPRHLITDVLTEIVTEQTTYAPNTFTHSNNMAGLTVSLEMRLMDADGNQVGAIPQAAAHTGIDASNPSVLRAAVSAATAGYFVPEGQWVEIGFKIDSLPSTAGVTMADISGSLGVVAHVLDYQNITHA